MVAARPDARGTLGDKPLVQLLVYLLDHNLSGSLVLETDAGARSAITFLGGAPTKTLYPAEQTRLGNLCVDYGLLTAADVSAALASATPGLIGQRLVALGKLSDDELASVLREQLYVHLEGMAQLPATTRYGFYRNKDFLETRLASTESADALTALWRVAQAAPPAGVADFAQRAQAVVMKLHPQSRVGRFGFAPEDRAVTDVLRVRPHRLDELLASGLLPRDRLELVLYVLALSRHLDFGHNAFPLGVDPTEIKTLLPRPNTRAPRLPGSVAPRSSQYGARSGHQPAPASTGQRPDSTAPHSRDQIEELLQRGKATDYYELLGVTPQVDTTAVSHAFFQLAKRWHPDKLDPELGADQRAQITKIFSRMTEAHQVLTSPEQRAEYDRLVAEGHNSDDEQLRVQEILKAATLFQKAEVLARRSDWTAAARLAQEAAQLDPDQAEYQALLAWVLAKGGSRGAAVDLNALLATLTAASNKHPHNARMRHYRAQVLQLAGKTHEAIREYRRVVELDPRNVDAQRELRLFQMRRADSRSPSPEKQGLLGKLFKKS